jgi:hypothetical protein
VCYRRPMRSTLLGALILVAVVALLAAVAEGPVEWGPVAGGGEP